MKAATADRSQMRRARAQVTEKSKEKRAAWARARQRKAERRALDRSLAAVEGVPSIELFQKEDDAKCHAVREELALLGLDYIARNVPSKDDLRHQELLRVGGKDQVPFLIDHRSGTHLYGSDTIVLYLEKEYGRPRPEGVSQLVYDLETRLKASADRLNWRARVIGARARRIRSDARDIWELLAGGARWVKQTIREAGS